MMVGLSLSFFRIVIVIPSAAAAVHNYPLFGRFLRHGDGLCPAVLPLGHK